MKKHTPIEYEDTAFDYIVSGDKLNIEYILMHELRDVDTSIGSPLYPEYVKILQRTAESHPEISKDKQYKEDLENAYIMEDSESDVIHNMREPEFKQIQVTQIKKTDYEKVDQAIRNALARHKLTFKKIRHEVL
jgi:hypothetical protein